MPSSRPEPRPLTDAVVDRAVTPHLMELVQGLITIGRQPDQALDDIERVVDQLRDQVNRDLRAAIEQGLPL